MVLKSSIRKKYFLKRKKKYFDIENKFFFLSQNYLKKIVHQKNYQSLYIILPLLVDI